MSDVDLAKYNTDKRVPCKYGADCYQKNPFHTSKYKHPPKDKKRKAETEDNDHKKKKQVKRNVQTKEKTKLVKEGNKPNKQERISDSDDDTAVVKGIVDNKGLINGEKNLTKKPDISDSDESNVDDSKKIIDNKDVDTTHKDESDSDETNDVKEKITPTTSRKDVTDKAEKTEHKSSEDDLSSDPQNNVTTKPNLAPILSHKEFIKTHFLLSPPDDFYKFWDLCENLNPGTPSDAFIHADLQLIGPFDVFAGIFKSCVKTPEEYLTHWRFYYDPPQLLTVLKSNDETGFHIGYFYDSENKPPALLVSNHGAKDGVFKKMGDNIFAAVTLYLQDFLKTCDPFKKVKITKLLGAVQKKGEELRLCLTTQSQKIKAREKKVVAKTFNKIGLVVPYNKKSQLGYRGLAMPDKELLELLTKLDGASTQQKDKYLAELQPLLTYTSIALDECDFGTGVKLGWELLFHGIDTLNLTISRFLVNSYNLLGEEAFAKITAAHLKNRKKGCKLSMF